MATNPAPVPEATVVHSLGLMHRFDHAHQSIGGLFLQLRDEILQHVPNNPSRLDSLLRLMRARNAVLRALNEGGIPQPHRGPAAAQPHRPPPPAQPPPAQPRPPHQRPRPAAPPPAAPPPRRR